MKRSILYIIVSLGLILTGNLPFRNHDVGKLRPVQVLEVSREGGILLRTDTGDMGRGGDWAEAVQSLEDTAPGTVFQGTVSYILLTEKALPLLPEVLAQEDLNPGCSVCIAPEGLDLKETAAYLDAHEPETNLRKLRAGDRTVLPRLTINEGRYLLVQP